MNYKTQLDQSLRDDGWLERTSVNNITVYFHKPLINKFFCTARSVYELSKTYHGKKMKIG
jgi:hypothetical protein